MMWATTRGRDGARVKKATIFLALLLLALFGMLLLPHGKADPNRGENSDREELKVLTRSRSFHKTNDIPSEVHFIKRADPMDIDGSEDSEDDDVQAGPSTAAGPSAAAGPAAVAGPGPGAAAGPANRWPNPASVRPLQRPQTQPPVHLIASDGASRHRIDVTAAQWVNDLVLRSWAIYVPLMLRTADCAAGVIDDTELKLRGGVERWQKDKIQHIAQTTSELHHWTRKHVTSDPQFRPRFMAQALSRFPVPGSQPLRNVRDLTQHVQSVFSETYAMSWKQDKPYSFKHPIRGTVQHVSYLERR